MRCSSIHLILIVLLLAISIEVSGKKKASSIVHEVNDLKEYKKLLRTKINVLILYINVQKSSQSIINVFKESADMTKGQATLVIIECNHSEGKKLCKKNKIPMQRPYYIKHYKDGSFHKDYDRSETVNSIVNFLKDPSGTLPWEEDPSAVEIFHLRDGDALTMFLRKGAGTYKKSMIMFYAPWCGYCNTLKPEYEQAASILRGDAMLAAIDVSKSVNSRVRKQYNITGFPTLLYYERGQFRFPYNGENTHQAIVDFIRDPNTQVQKKKEAVDEIWSEDTDVIHLTLNTFDTVLSKAEHALVVFYAPWCGHCKRIKPEFEKAATEVKKLGIDGILGAVDATIYPELIERFSVKGYPTLKYFNKGQYKFDAAQARKQKQIIEFMKDPKEPPAPPLPETPWSEEESHVRHLSMSTFRQTLRKFKHALVMFYAPWCGHCKNMKPEFVSAADQFSEELLVGFGAVDCTVETNLCAMYEVKGYPTIKYFSYYDKVVKDYNGGRKEIDMVLFINRHMGMQQDTKAPKSNQEAGFGTNVVLVTDDNFESMIAATAPTFVMFYATWCGHCSTVKPQFSRLATSYKDKHSPVQIIAVDAAENPKVADIAGIKTLPSFKLYVNGKFLAEYTGDRSAEDMTNFINTTNMKDEL